MTAAHISPEKTDLRALATLASLLQKLETSSTPVDPLQYQTVARRLADLLTSQRISDPVRALLYQFPAAAELYENLNYQHAGLCLHALDASMPAEKQALQLIRATSAR